MDVIVKSSIFIGGTRVNDVEPKQRDVAKVKRAAEKKLADVDARLAALTRVRDGLAPYWQTDAGYFAAGTSGAFEPAQGAVGFFESEF